LGDVLGAGNAVRRRPDPAATLVRVGVVEEVEIFRRGLVACLAEDPAVEVRVAAAEPPLTEPADVAVVSAHAAADHPFSCPVVVCCADRDEPHAAAAINDVAGVLVRGTMTEPQLHASVRAAAAGLRVNADPYAADAATDPIEPRSVRVLELLAEGRSTREIAGEMSYSERTIKKVIHEIEGLLDARSRAQAVALAIRGGLI
jgi:DNA-binding CsgD family transcriptional regulator